MEEGTMSSSFLALVLLAAPPALEPGFESLRLITGPAEGKLGTVATIKVPEGWSFVDGSQMALFNKLTGNLDNPNDVGGLIAPEKWVVFFSFDNVGYIADDEKDELDADD